MKEIFHFSRNQINYGREIHSFESVLMEILSNAQSVLTIELNDLLWIFIKILNYSRKLTFSSDPSGQSCSPSQRHLDVMQYFSEHWNCFTGSHIFGEQLASSLPSPQSSSRSHTHRFCIHRPLLQVNSSERHVLSKVYIMVIKLEFESHFEFEELLIDL